MKKINAIMFADTHGSLKYDKLKILDNEIKKYKIHTILTLGDIKMDELFRVQEFADKNKILDLYGVLGNHDKENYFDNLHIKNLHGKKIEINGISFSGWQGSLKYKEENYLGYTQEESLLMMNNIPNADILISHDIPKQDGSTHHHQGLEGIKIYMDDGHAKLNFHGHVHNRKIIDSSIGVYRCAIVTIYKIFNKKLIYKIKYIF